VLLVGLGVGFEADGLAILAVAGLLFYELVYVKIVHDVFLVIKTYSD